MATYADGPGLDDNELARLLRVFPHVIQEAKMGHGVTGFVRLGARWHTADAAVKYLRSGAFDPEREDAADALASWETEKPIRESIAAADAQREKEAAARYADAVAKAKVRTDRQASADAAYARAQTAAGLNPRHA